MLDPEARDEEAEATPDALTPLPQGEPLSRDESIARMYARYEATFEALAK